MVKSRSEICKDYRRRLKEKDNDGYLRKERARRRKNYTPSDMLTNAERVERRRKTREAVKRCRDRRKQAIVQANRSPGYDTLDSSGYESVNDNHNLVVAMNFPNRAFGPRKRMKKELTRANKTIQELKRNNIDLARKLKTEQRRRQRLVKRLNGSPRTPKSKSENVMNTAGLTEIQKNTVRREILFGNIVGEQLRNKKESRSKSTMKGLHMAVAGQIIRKYRAHSIFCKKTGLNINTMSKYTGRTTEKEKAKPTRKYERLIIEFLERDDNSRIQPGKADTVKRVVK
jgi:hypothetical protein